MNRAATLVEMPAGSEAAPALRDLAVAGRAQQAASGSRHAVCLSSPERLDDATILVVESNVDIGGVLVEQLVSDGYRAELARSAEHARMLARRSRLRLALLGGLDSRRGALELLQEIREFAPGKTDWARELPIIMLAAEASELDLLRAFDCGADDFIARPMRYLELRARVRALLRRIEWTSAPAHRLSVGPLEIDMDGHVVSLYGQTIALRRLEFELLVHLARDPERVFTKQELLRAVWGYRSNGSTRTVDSHASRLRCKLGVGRWVVNIWGVGYRLK